MLEGATLHVPRESRTAAETKDLGGVYRSAKTIDGRPVWYALGEKGNLLPPGLRVLQDGETEAMVAADLSEIAKAERAARRPGLTIVPRAPAASSPPSSPGPSPAA